VVRRFRYFPARWEDLAHGAILENLRARRSRWLQVPPFLIAECCAVLRAVRSDKPDVIHAHWILPQGVVARLCAPRVPLVLTTLGGDLYAVDSPLARKVKAWTLRGAGAVTVMNEEMRARVIELGVSPDRARVLPMGADVSAVRQATRRAPAPSAPVQFLFVGRLVEKKGLVVLLDALRSLEAAGGWALTVVGDGPLRAELERTSSGLPVSFQGQLGRTELSLAYSASDVAVFPSVRAASGDQDGLPVALLEAMAAGCGIVASDLPGINEAVQNGTSGILVEPGDSGKLASALHQMLESADIRARMGQSARERADAFDVSRIGDKYVALLMSVCRAPAGTSS